MKSNPLVSVVIPTYNYGRFIGETIDSSLAQSYSPVEIIVVDDGSTDDTRERLAGYDDHVRYIYQQNRGLSAARNTGIEAARGEFIALLDSDDLWLPQKLERQVALYAEHHDVGLVASNRFAVDQNGKLLDEQRPDELGFVEITMLDLLEFPAFSPSSALVRKECFQEVGAFDVTLRGAEDMEMWLRIAARFRVLRLNATLQGQRIHVQSMAYGAKASAIHMHTLNKAFAQIPQLRQNPRWRRIAEGRQYREAAYLCHAAGDRMGALKNLLRSVKGWPFALRDSQGEKRHLERAKMFFKYSMARSSTS